MANRLPSKPPSERPSRPSAPDREAQLQATLDATVVELSKKAKRVEDLEKRIAELQGVQHRAELAEKELADSKEAAARYVPPPSLKPRIDELEAFLRRCIHEGVINYTEAGELLNRK